MGFAGGFDLGVTQAGFDVVAKREPDAFDGFGVSQVEENLGVPDVQVTAPEFWRAVRADMVFGNPPCFSAGTMVVAERGVVPIEEIVVGDRVLTRYGRWKPVTATMSREAETIRVDGGNLEATPEHPILARHQSKKRRGQHRTLDGARWVHASDIRGEFVAVPRTVETLQIPAVGGRRSMTMDAAFWWFVGRWLGDGWIRIVDAGGDKPPRSVVHVCCSTEEGDYLEERLLQTGLRWHKTPGRGGATWRFSADHFVLARWLRDNFGHGAREKTMPGWLFGTDAESRTALLEGYLSADGYIRKSGTQVAGSASLALAVGVRVLATTLGYTTSFAHRDAIEDCTIEGRPVESHESWAVSINDDDGRYTYDDTVYHRWQKVRRKNLPGRVTTVYDLTVEDDHSFVANGLVVSNCSGFSMLSSVNKVGHRTWKEDQRGINSSVNDWLYSFVSYTAAVRPEVAIFESVQSAGKMGEPLMRLLWQNLRAESGLDYELTLVFMNAALVGGNCIRPRMFWVAHRRPFGVNLPRETPLTLREVIGDLPDEEDWDNPAWGHRTIGGKTTRRIERTIRDLRAAGHDWKPGERLSDAFKRFIADGGAIPDYWYVELADGSRRALSHATRDHLYVPVRAKPDVPFGVIVGDALSRVIHPWAPRTITYREAARLMGLPDYWSLRPMVEAKQAPWLGKGIPVASGRWIAEWARASMAGAPGEYAGVEVEPGYRMVDVTTRAKVDAIERDQEAPVWWERSAHTIHRSSIDLRPSLRPAESGLGPHEAPSKTHPEPPRAVVEEESRPRVVRRERHEPRAPRVPTPLVPRGSIARVPPEEVQGLLTELGLSRHQAAEALGVSASRVTELTTHTRPKSWLNADRWSSVEAALRSYAP
jgi:site-specific DNA-cytosine methylase